MPATIEQARKAVAVQMADHPDMWRTVVRRRFRAFVREFWDTVPGSAPLVWNWHMDVICDAMQGAAERVFRGLPKLYDLIFNVPPGTSKSTLCSILFPAWVWTRMPHARIITASHTSDLVLDLSARSRGVLLSEKYQDFFPDIKFVEDQDTKGHFRNTAGGERLCCTVSGKSPIGLHAHFQIVDDPIDPKKARSEANKQTAREFFTDVLPGRKVDKEVTVLFLIMQRLGIGDPTDVMLQVSKREDAAPVVHYCLPAELTDNVSPPALRSHYEANGGLLDPHRLPMRVLKRERATMGEYAYAGQMLQKPTPPGGGMFKATYFTQFAKAAPYKAKRIRYWDRASTENGGCATAGVLIAYADGDYYIEHVVVGHWEPDERNSMILATAQKDRRKYGRYQPKIYVEREGGSSGKDSFKGLARKLAGYPVREDSVTGSKDVRAEPWAAQLAAMNVRIVDNGESEGGTPADWDVQGYIDEHLAFRPVPGKRVGGLCDQVDASTGAFNLLVGRHAPGTLPLRKITLRPRKEGQPVKILALSGGEVASTSLDMPCLLVWIADPPVEGEERTPHEHGLSRVVAKVELNFLDIDPAEMGPDWTQPVDLYGKKPEELCCTKELGRKMWSVLLRPHDPPPEVVVFACPAEDDRRALSAAVAFADALRYRRREALLSADGGDNVPGIDGDAPNGHVYSVLKAARSTVV